MFNKTSDFQKHIQNHKGYGLTTTIVASVVLATLIGSATSWWLSMKNSLADADDRMEAMTIALSEWNRLEHMQLSELRENKINLETPYLVGEKFKVSVHLGEEGYFDKGLCNPLTGTYEGYASNCFDRSSLSIYSKDGAIPLYTTRSMPLSVASSTFPLGTILPYSGDLADIPSGWALCDGTNGTPDLRGKFLEGSDISGNFKEAGLPNITGWFHGHLIGWIASSAYGGGAFYISSKTDRTGGADAWGQTMPVFNFDASRSNAIYGKSTTVQPPSFTVFYIMRVNGTFNYNHTAPVNPSFYTKEEVDALLKEQYDKIMASVLRKDSTEYVRNGIVGKTTSVVEINDTLAVMTDDKIAYLGGGEAIGTIVPRLSEDFSSEAEKDSYLFCDGSTFSSSDYPTLYSILGTNVLPDLRERTLWGGDVGGSYIDAGLPNIKGGVGWWNDSNGVSQSGALYLSSSRHGRGQETGYGGSEFVIGFDASRFNSIYGASTTVQPPAVSVRFYIRAK